MFTNKSSKSLVGISPPSSDTGVSPALLLTVTDAELSWAMDGHPWLYEQVLTTPGESHSQTTRLSHGNIFVCSWLSVITCVLGIHKHIASMYLVCSHMGPVGRASLVPRLLSAGEEPGYEARQSHNNSQFTKKVIADWSLNHVRECIMIWWKVSAC